MRWIQRAIALSFVAVSAAQAQDARDPVARLEAKLFNKAAKPNPPMPAKQPGYLGVVTEEDRQRGRGVRVVEVAANGPAAKSGVQAGDLITAVRGKPVRQMRDVVAAMEGSAAGDVIAITLVRDGRGRTVHPTLAHRADAPAKAKDAVKEDADRDDAPPKRDPADKAAAPEPGAAPVQPGEEVPAPGATPIERAGGGALLGAVMRSHADDPRFVFGRPAIAGAMVTAVVPGSPAATAGLFPGDIVVGLNRQATRSKDELRATLALYAPGELVELTIYRGRLVYRATVRLAAASPATPSILPGIELPGIALPGIALPGIDIQLPRIGMPRVAPAPAEAPPANNLDDRVKNLQERLDRLEKSLKKS